MKGDSLQSSHQDGSEFASFLNTVFMYMILICDPAISYRVIISIGRMDGYMVYDKMILFRI